MNIPLAILQPSGRVARMIAALTSRRGIPITESELVRIGAELESDDLDRYAQTDFSHIARSLDALELRAKGELVAELRRVRAALAEQLKTDKSPKEFKTLPHRAELEAAVRAMLDRASVEGRMALRVEVERAGEYAERIYAAASFTPRAAVKWLAEAAFWVTDVLADDLLSDAQGILVRGLKNGTATSVMMRELWEAFVPYLGGEVASGEVITAHRLETIVRTNTTTAYNHGRLTEALDPEIARFVDGVQFNAILDTRTTEVCRFLNGKVFRLPAQEAELEALLPPRHFNCRSIITTKVVGDPIDPASVITASEIAQAQELSGTGFSHRGVFRQYVGDPPPRAEPEDVRETYEELEVTRLEDGRVLVKKRIREEPSR